MKRNFTFQYDNDLKHTSKSTMERAQLNRMKGFGMTQPESRTKSNGTSVRWLKEGRAKMSKKI